MAQRKTLTEQQVTVLRWVGDGCPDGAMPDLSHRVSTAALDKRGLVEVTGKRDTWAATITKAGRDYLDAVDGPSPLVPRQANLSATEQLVQDVIDAGGTLKVPRKRYHDKTRSTMSVAPDSLRRTGRCRQGSGSSVSRPGRNWSFV